MLAKIRQIQSSIVSGFFSKKFLLTPYSSFFRIIIIVPLSARGDKTRFA